MKVLSFIEDNKSNSLTIKFMRMHSFDDHLIKNLHEPLKIYPPPFVPTLKRK